MSTVRVAQALQTSTISVGNTQRLNIVVFVIPNVERCSVLVVILALARVAGGVAMQEVVQAQPCHIVSAL